MTKITLKETLISVRELVNDLSTHPIPTDPKFPDDTPEGILQRLEIFVARHRILFSEGKKDHLAPDYSIITDAAILVKRLLIETNRPANPPTKGYHTKMIN